MPHTEETGSYHTHIHHCPMHSGAKYINHNLAACSVITIAQRQILIIAYILYFGRTIDGVFASVCVCVFFYLLTDECRVTPSLDMHEHIRAAQLQRMNLEATCHRQLFRVTQ